MGLLTGQLLMGENRGSPPGEILPREEEKKGGKICLPQLFKLINVFLEQSIRSMGNL